MSLTVPDDFQRPSVAAERLELDAIVRTKHVKAVAESGHFVRARLRPFLSFGGEDQTTTSTSYADLVEGVACEASASNSDAVTVDAYGGNVDLEISITGASAATVTGTINLGAGPTNGSVEINTSTLTGTAWRLKVRHKLPATGTGHTYAIHIREKRHTSGTIA
jgi:hypothetical protein